MSVLIDLDKKKLSLKQKESCKKYDVKISIAGVQKEGKLPNIADIFDLWPYIMYYN